MRLQVISDAGRLKAVFAKDGKALSGEAVHGLLKVSADVKIDGEWFRAVIFATAQEDKITVSVIGKAVTLSPRSDGYGTRRYAIQTSRGKYLMETFFGKVYQCLVVWECDDRDKTIRTCSLSFDPDHHSLIISGDVDLFTDVMSSILTDTEEGG